MLGVGNLHVWKQRASVRQGQSVFLPLQREGKPYGHRRRHIKIVIQPLLLQPPRHVWLLCYLQQHKHSAALYKQPQSIAPMLNNVLAEHLLRRQT
jgi:hypothetical protein